MTAIYNLKNRFVHNSVSHVSFSFVCLWCWIADYSILMIMIMMTSRIIIIEMNSSNDVIYIYSYNICNLIKLHFHLGKQLRNNVILIFFTVKSYVMRLLEYRWVVVDGFFAWCSEKGKTIIFPFNIHSAMRGWKIWENVFFSGKYSETSSSALFIMRLCRWFLSFWEGGMR